MMRKMSKIQLHIPCLIEWHDILGQTGWMEGKDPSPPVVCYTYGWIVKKDKKYLSVCSTKQENQLDGSVIDYADANSIPKGCIVSITYLMNGGNKCSINGVQTAVKSSPTLKSTNETPSSEPISVTSVMKK